MKKLTNIVILAFLGLCFNGKITAQEWVEYPQAIPTDYTLAAHDLVGKVKSVKLRMDTTNIAEKMFNEDGNLVKELNYLPDNNLKPTGSTMEYSYNKFKKPVTITTKNEGTVETLYFQYDETGKLLACNADKSGKKKHSYSYDANNRVTAARFYDKDGKLQNMHKIEYDDAGRIVKISDFNECEKDCNNLRLFNSYTYSEEGLLLEELLNPDTELLSYSFTYIYNEEGQLISQALVWSGEPSMEVNREFSYDEEGRMEQSSSTVISNGNLASDTISLYEYDEQGNWITRTSTQEDEVVLTEIRIIEYY